VVESTASKVTTSDGTIEEQIINAEASLDIGLSGEDLEILKKVKDPIEKKARKIQLLRERLAKEKEMKEELFRGIKNKKHKSRKAKRSKYDLVF
jgi:hypothetical protein